MSLRKPSSFYSGLEVYIDGDIVGAWEIKDAPLGNSSVLKKIRYVPLTDLLSDIDISSILIIGTQIGITDVFSQLSADTASGIPSTIVRVANKDSLLNDIYSSISRDVKAFVIVRGGDDKTMAVWDDPEVISALLSFNIPFYTALGHSHSVTLVDKFSDSAYHTPTAFGRTLNAVLSQNLTVENAVKECIALKAENEILKRTTAIPHRQHTRNIGWVKILLLLVNYTCLIFMIGKWLG